MQPPTRSRRLHTPLIQQRMAQKYLRMFTSASLSALLRLCLKSTAGTAFEVKESTTVAEAMQAIRNGQITAADVIVGFGGFIDGAKNE